MWRQSCTIITVSPASGVHALIGINVLRVFLQTLMPRGCFPFPHADSCCQIGWPICPQTPRLCTRRASLCLAAGRDIPILCSGGGTPHVPAVLGPTGHVIHESTAYAHYLATERDVPASCILKETSSYDTIGNAYFSIKTHVVPAGWR